MKRLKWLPLAMSAVVCLALQLATAYAAVVMSGDVDPADANDWNSSTVGFVGSTGDGALEVNGGSDLASDYCYIGYGVGLTGAVTVDGADSTWTNSNNLYIGSFGNGTLNISSGGVVANSSGYIGTGYDSTVVVTVDGTGSMWTSSSDLFVGYEGSGTLHISGGAAVNNSFCRIGYGSNSTGVVTIDGTGSTWANSGDLYVGRSGSGTLTVTGGAVSNEHGYIGHDSDSTGVVTVDGTGSTWANSGDLYVGRFGSGTLSISDGADVSTAGSTYVADRPGSKGTIHFGTIHFGTGNLGTGSGTLTTGSLLASPTQLTGTGTINARALVSDVDLVFDSTASLAQTFVFDGQPGQNITVNLDMASNPASNGALGAGWKGDGSLAIRGGVTVNSASGHIGASSGSTGLVTVDGAGTTWTNRREVYVGYAGSGTLNITDGAAVTNSFGYIGYDSGSTGVVTVNGTGSTWTSAWGYVGRSGNGTLDISGGAAVSNFLCYIGDEPGSTGVVTVDGANSTWNNRGNLYVGNEGSGALDITGGATVSNSDSFIGDESGSTGAVTVDGAGSNWTGSGRLYVGRIGNGTLNITGGATVSSQSGHMAVTSNSMAVLTVDGADSTWTSTYGLTVGYTGSATLEVTDGATVSTSHGYIADGPGSTGVVRVDGAGSKWTNSERLYIGRDGNGTLSIAGGAAVNNFFGFIGKESVVAVEGIGSTWTNRGALSVGGTLDISGGAEVSAVGLTNVASEGDFNGLIHFGTGGGTLTTESLLASPLQLTGIGTVNTRGLVSDIDLVFDSTASLRQTLVFRSQPEHNVTVNLDMVNDASSNAILGSGWKGHGSLTIRDGVTVNSGLGYIGRNSGSTGVVTVDGADSTWANGQWLFIGYYGSGTLNITGGAAVSNSRTSDIGTYPGSTGVVTVDGLGSKWTNREGLQVGNYGNGKLNITGGGEVHSSSGYIGDRSGSTGEVTVDGTGSTWTSSFLKVGLHGSGTLNITNGGAAVSNNRGTIGNSSGSTGVVTVDGAGSTWTNGGLTVGHQGSGKLNIRGAAVVSDSRSYIGRLPGSTGVVTVDGTGSTWTNAYFLYVGEDGSGTLRITRGGNVSAERVSINSQSLLTVDVDNGSLLEIDGGNGTITNDGKVRLLAGAGAMAGNVYEPIAATEWDGTGTYQAVGGTWDEASHQFSVSGVVSGTSGSTVTIDRSQRQRLLVDDAQTGWSVGASFLSADSTSELNLTATVTSGSMLADLASLMEADESVRGAWTFDVAGNYTAGDPAYLSFDLGSGFDRADLNLWHYDGSQWAEYAAADLTCNGGYASFTVTGFSGYAVSAVPEPGSLAMLLGGVAGLVAVGWRRRSR